ncbi:Fic family protein [Bacillus thuringiensis]|uniref:Fic family protein n=1 Tax=Bacillus thuringiensis TaxID=1428 RepID=A0AAW9GMG1_BACTU|nr:Fic family protein [Bacillus thuringiensis]MDY0855089.1 Fic family protein [Bacillus thuringiensis]MDY4395168.1 Fic family protein [Bacillus thuringiensis]
MRDFFEDKYLDIELQRELVKLISEISEYKGKISAYQERNPDIFNNLEKTIPLHYIKNFNSVFLGIKVPNKRLKELILNGMLPKTTEEDAIFCYYQTLSLVQKKFYDLPTNPETIQELHFQLIHYITSDSAMWREKEFIVPVVPEYGMHSSSYRPLSRKLIPKSVEQLCEQYNILEANKEFHSLILIARFMLNFYCILPFNQGNRRLAFILMQLLLMKNEHTFIKYICLDKYITKHESRYYKSIFKSSVNWYCSGHNISFWLKIFLTIILDAYRDLHLIVQGSICRYTKIERIKNYILKQKNPFTKEDIRGVYPDIAESTISKALASFQSLGHIKLVSRGRNAQWIRI